MTWTCSYCGWPNFMSDEYCHHCGHHRPAGAYQKIIVIYSSRTSKN